MYRSQQQELERRGSWRTVPGVLLCRLAKQGVSVEPPHRVSWAPEGHGGSSDRPSPSLQAAKLEEVAGREPLKSAGRWKPDGWPACLPACRAGACILAWPAGPADPWVCGQGGNQLPGWLQGQVLCSSQEVAPEVG